MCDQGLMKGRIGQVMRFGRDSSTSQPEGEDFEQGSAGSASGSELGSKRKGSTTVDGEGDIAEPVLKRPAGGEVKANTAGGVANAGADFEELCAQGFDLGRTPRERQLQTKEVDQVVSGGVQEQAEGVGQEAVTAQAVGAEAVFELLDAILALPAIVVESKDLGGRSVAVGDQKAQVGSGSGMFGLVTDAALARPTAGAMAEAGKAALG